MALAWPGAASAAPESAATVTMPADDALLLVRTARGDHDAFAELFRRYERPARTLALRTLRDADAAEDAVQEAFLHLWRDAARIQPTGSLRAYILVLVSRRAIDILRKRAPAPSDELPDLPAPVHATNPARAAQARDRAHIMAQAMEALPPRQRLVVLLVYTEDVSVRDAADAVGVTPKAAESLLSRARETLRTQLESHRSEFAS